MSWLPRTLSLVLGLVLVLVATWCGACRAASNLPVVQVELKAKDGTTRGAFQAEVVSTNEQRAKGLMFRRHVGAQQGMLFLFPVERRQSFWMKNTLIPLDMIFISGNWRVVGIVENATPLSEESRSVPEPSQYVLEVAGGASARLGLSVGDRVEVFGALPSAQ